MRYLEPAPVSCSHTTTALPLASSATSGSAASNSGSDRVCTGRRVPEADRPRARIRPLEPSHGSHTTSALPWGFTATWGCEDEAWPESDRVCTELKALAESAHRRTWTSV